MWEPIEAYLVHRTPDKFSALSVRAALRLVGASRAFTRQAQPCYDLLAALVPTPMGHIYGEGKRDGDHDEDWEFLEEASKHARALDKTLLLGVYRRAKTVLDTEHLRAPEGSEATTTEASLSVPHLLPIFTYPDIHVSLPEVLRLQPVTIEVTSEKSSVFDLTDVDGRRSGRWRSGTG